MASQAQRIYDAIVRQIEDNNCINRERLMEDIADILGTSQHQFLWASDIGRSVSTQYASVWEQHYKTHEALHDNKTHRHRASDCSHGRA